MDEIYSLKVGSEGLEALEAKLSKLNEQIDSLGGSTKGLSKLQKEVAAVETQLAKAQRSTQVASTSLASSLEAKAKAIKGVLGAVEGATKQADVAGKQFLTNLIKNNNFSKYLSDLDKLNRGHQFTSGQLQKLTKQAQDFNSAMSAVRGDSGVAKAFQQMFGSKATGYLQGNDFTNDLKKMQMEISRMERESTRKSLDSTTKHGVRNQQLNDQTRDRVKLMRDEVAMSKLTSSQLEKQLASLRAVRTEYQRIQSMPVGADRSSAFREFRRSYGSAAATAASQKSISTAITSGEARTAQLKASAEGKSLDTMVKQSNTARELNAQFAQRLAIAQATEITGAKQMAQLEAQLTYLKTMRNEYARISALQAGGAKSAELRQYVAKYGASAATSAGMASVTSSIAAGETTLNRWKQINGEVRSALVSSRDLHQVWRGMSAGVNQIWMSWGSLAPMAVGLASSFAVFKSLSVGKDFGWQMEQVGVAAEAGSQQVAELSQKILDLSSQNMVQGPMQMAEALKVLTQAGLKANDAFKALPTTLNLALVAGDLSDEDSARFLAGLRSAFTLDNADGSLNAQALREAADQTAMAANVSQTSIGKMSEALKQASSEAARFGLSVTDTSSALAILAKYNIEGSAAGTSLKNFLSDLSGRTAKSKKALEQLGLTIYTASGMVKPFSQVVAELQDKLRGLTDKQQQEWLKAIFNERGLKTANILLSKSGDEFVNLHNQISRAGENMGYTTTQAARLGDTAQGSFMKMKNSWESAFASVGQASDGDFKSLMSTLSGVANDHNTRDLMSGMTATFLKLAEAAVTVGSALTPLAPLIGGVGAAIAASSLLTWVKGLGLIPAVLAAVTTGMTRVTLATQTFAAVQAGTATTLAGTTGAMAGLRVGVLSLMTSMGPIGWAALAAGGVATYLIATKDAAVDLSSEIKNLDSSLAAVKTDVLEKFNSTGLGTQLDQKLGIGFKPNFKQYAVEAETTVQAFEANRQKIDAAVQDSLSKLNEGATSSASYRIEQETMLLDRKKTLLSEELKRFDQSTQDKNTLDTESARIRGNLVTDLYNLEAQLMQKRTELALTHMQELRADALKTENFFARMFNSVTEGTAARDRDLRVKFGDQSTLSESDKQYKVLREQGVQQREAMARTSSTFGSDDLYKRLNLMYTRTGITQVESQITQDAQRTATYLQDLKVGAENLLASVKEQRKHSDSKNLQDQERVVSGALWNINTLAARAAKKSAQEVKSASTVRQAPNILEGTPSYDPKAGGTAKARKPQEFDDTKIKQLQIQASEQQLERVKKQAEVEKASFGYVSDSTVKLVQAQEANVKALREASGDIKKANVIKKLQAILDSATATPDEKAKATKQLADVRAIPDAKLDTDFGFSFTLKNDKVGYALGAKNLANGVIDCSGFVMALMNATYKDLNDKLGSAQFSTKGIKDQSSEGIIQYFAKQSGMVMSGRKNNLDASKILPGMLIGTDNGKTSFDAGRQLGIDHIVQVVLSPTGQKMVAQSRGGSGSGRGVGLTSLESYLKGSNAQAYVVDSLGGKRGALGSAGGAFTGASNSEFDAKANALAKTQKLIETKKIEIQLEQDNIELQNQRGEITDKQAAKLKMELSIRQAQVDAELKIAELQSKGVVRGQNGDGEWDAITVTEQQTDQKIEQITEAYKAAKAAQEDWRVGLSRSYNSLVDESTNYGSFAQQAFSSVTEGIIGSMQTLATTGKLNFREMAASILSDLAKIAMRMAMLKLVNIAMSSWSGGTTMTGGSAASFGLNAAARGATFSGGRTLAYAAGGIVHGPKTFALANGSGLMGEAGPEGVFPLTRLSNGDLGVQAVGGGTNNVNSPVSVAVTINKDGSSESEVDAEGLGKRMGSAIQSTVYSILVKESRSGGMLNKPR